MAPVLGLHTSDKSSPVGQAEQMFGVRGVVWFFFSFQKLLLIVPKPQESKGVFLKSTKRIMTYRAFN